MTQRHSMQIVTRYVLN